MSESLALAVVQMAASTDWPENLTSITDGMAAESERGSALTVFPEGVLARFTDAAAIRQAAQPLDGPFVTGLLVASTRTGGMTTVVGIHEDSGGGRVWNTLVAVRGGELVGLYRKLHLYDAFAELESDHVAAADVVPPLLDVDGFAVGLMTCYDVRFPELARLLAVAGAELILVPAAWVRGPLKEHHWRTLVTARALENTVWVAASGECGPKNIGRSMVVDPLGVVTGDAGEGPGVLRVEITKDRVAEARRRLPVLENRRFDVNPTPRPLPTR